MIEEKRGSFSHIVALCIGTDRVTGDCLGPFVGDRLEKAYICRVYGTLHKPVHAKNLSSALNAIAAEAGRPLVIAVDAALGSHIGHITVADEGLKPGAALNKNLPAAGSIGITGIVNSDSCLGINILRNTRLSKVMDMSEIIAEGLTSALSELSRSNFEASAGLKYGS